MAANTGDLIPIPDFLTIPNLNPNLGTIAALTWGGLYVLLEPFVGHGAFEGRAPALLDNLVQAIFLAPLFVWLELLFKFGYRRELRQRVEKAVQVEVAKFRSNKAAKNGKAQ
ncbi:putative duf962 domain-containing protein [Eutypa lata UCREL1]|uniref:Putative duf962 domain-containing protein n=1 Tax=Eutypa lata (strain UCR-EL1) TaxID=1287681 RepID=M7TFP1_EUTLA|nr:putative duf962 domain-containing protein [Eutypa lata UCREL1]